MTQVLMNLRSRWIGRHLRNYSTTKISKKWKSVVGLEIHAQIASTSKLFSGARNSFSEPINTAAALLDASIPGTLPVLNKRCVELGVKTALALSCKINEVSMFDRKHYFYADLPAGYQITQQRAPLASNGSLTFPVLGDLKKPYYKTVRLHQLQLEQDSGKSLHDEGLGISFIDLNRAGVPLMELVFDPDLSDGEEAAALVKELVLIMRSLDTCNCRMEEGSFRVDANISIHQENEPLGTRTEVKNISSVRGVAKAVEYEIQRQIAVKEKGGDITNETRSWDAPSKTTIVMRDKEVVQDYRFMPEPNLPPLHLNLNEQLSNKLVNVCALKSEIPVLPQQQRDQLITEKGLSLVTADILVNVQKLLEYFTLITEANPKRSSKIVSNFLITDLLGFCTKNEMDIEDCKMTAEHIGELIDLLESKVVSVSLAHLILKEMLESSKSPMQIADEKNLKQISDDTEILKACEEVLQSESGVKMVKAYKSGKTKVLRAIAGEINRKADNRINMAKVVKTLENLLKK